MAVSAEAILSVLAEEAGIDRTRLRSDATLLELDISSIDVVSALFALEEKFGIEVDAESIAPDSTVAAFVQHVMSLSAR